MNSLPTRSLLCLSVGVVDKGNEPQLNQNNYQDIVIDIGQFSLGQFVIRQRI